LSDDKIILRPLEARILEFLSKAGGKADIREIVENTGLDYVEVMRGASWLINKGILEINEEKNTAVRLLNEGEEYAVNGLPERKLVNTLRKLGGEADLDLIKKETKMNENVFRIALGWVRRKNWAKIEKKDGKVILIASDANETPDEELLRILKEKGEIFVSDIKDNLIQGLNWLKSRKNLVELKEISIREATLTDKGRQIVKQGYKIAEEVSQLTNELIRSGKWRDVTLRKFDVEAPVPRVYPAKIHPVILLIQKIRNIFLEFGFKEIKSPLVEAAFWNFDALFVPQDHPARDVVDTFYLERPKKANLRCNTIIENVAKTHETGGSTGSKGWRYKWEHSEALRTLLRTHTTAATVRYLSSNPEIPSKVFCIDRVYRNERVDYKHIPEFMQIEGIIIDENVTLRDLLGILMEFYKRMGFTKIRARPGYFPFTEPSLEVDLYSPKLGKWIEMVGAGIFRPEVTEPLGIKCPVLAWGGGFERLAMIKFGLTDIRDLYKNNLEWLRKTPYI